MLNDAANRHRFTEAETARNMLFAAQPMLADFVSTALQDLQFSENDEACTEGREARDTGTIYDMPFDLFGKLAAIVERFELECSGDIERALDLEPQGEGFEYAREPITQERLGSTLWLAITGSGVGFTDDGNAPCLERLAAWATAFYCEGLQFGDDGTIYLIAH